MYKHNKVYNKTEIFFWQEATYPHDFLVFVLNV